MSEGAWPIVSLGELIASIEAGASFRCRETPPEADEVGVAKVSAVSWGRYDENESKTCLDASRIDPSLLIQKGDFLISRANTVQLVGACVIAQRVTKQVMLSDKTLRIQFTDPSLKPWILHFLRSREGRNQIEALCTGNQESMRNISQKSIRQIQLPLAPVEERDRVVAYLDQQLSRLQASIEIFGTIQAKLKQARASILKAAVEGRLVETEAELARSDGREYEDATSFLARITSDKQGKSSKMRRLPDRPEETEAGIANPTALPEGWSLVTISDVGETITGSTPPTSEPDFYEDKGIPFLKPTDLNNGINTGSARQYLSAKGSARARLVPPLTVLVTCIGATIGKTGLATSLCATNQQINCLIPSPEIAKTKYLFWFLCSPFAQYDITTNASATTLPILNKSKFSRLPVFLPPPAEQYRIVAEVDRRFSVLDQVEATIQTSLARCSMLRQAILKRAFRG